MRIAFHATAEKEIEDFADDYDLQLRSIVVSENKSATFSRHLFRLRAAN